MEHDIEDADAAAATEQFLDRENSGEAGAPR